MLPRWNQFSLALALLCSSVLAHGCASAPGVLSRLERAGHPLTPDVTWLAPNGERDLGDLARWRRSVGPPVILAGMSTATAADTLIVVSWNTHVGGGDLARLFADVRRRAGSDVPIVLLLQEAYRGGPEVPKALDPGSMFASLIHTLRRDGGRDELESVARALGLNAYYVPSMRNGGPLTSDEDRGNAILSTLPLTDLSAIELPFERQRRVAVGATVKGTTHDGRPWRMRVVSAHFDTMGGARRLWIAGSEFGRTRQARGLLAALENQAPLVLGADMNTLFGFREGAYAAAARAFPGTPLTDRRPTFRGLLRLDHMFFRLADGWKAAFRRGDDNFGSDHYPLIGTVDFASATP
jgi:endonuclease/exonuclease/phosphatase family metal-dependent hydrolase